MFDETKGLPDILNYSNPSVRGMPRGEMPSTAEPARRNLCGSTRTFGRLAVGGL